MNNFKWCESLINQKQVLLRYILYRPGKYWSMSFFFSCLKLTTYSPFHLPKEPIMRQSSHCKPKQHIKAYPQLQSRKNPTILQVYQICTTEHRISVSTTASQGKHTLSHGDRNVQRQTIL